MNRLPQLKQSALGFLQLPAAYRLTQSLLGARGARDRIVTRFVRPRSGEAILDVGCGTGDILGHLPEGVRYHGIDLHGPYVEAARARWGSRGEFEHAGVEEVSERDVGTYDVVLATGLLHHLDDDSAAKLVTLIRKALRPGGRFVSSDPCLTDPQNPIARFLVRSDRGEHVRTEAGYASLFEGSGLVVETTVCTDLLSIPYTHVLCVARRG